MKIGVFTPLLSALPLDQVLKKLKGLGPAPSSRPG